MRNALGNDRVVRYVDLTPTGVGDLAPARRRPLPDLGRAVFTLFLGIVLSGAILLADRYVDEWSEAGILTALVVLWVAVLAWKGIRHE